MANDLQQQIREVFIKALELPVAERDAYLQQATEGQPARLAQLRSLLIAYEQAGEFLSLPTEAPTIDQHPSRGGGPLPGEAVGVRIGAYKLLQLIGEGGFGSVYLAEQQEPVVRKVALKIIKLGMDTRQVIARFEAERQALAMMDHPHIARVFDAGATEQGRPYFVMELVKGDPIVEYCDKHNLRIDERLELFAQVCNAVQHAHTKGIIHRDIKPSNVLVSKLDGRPSAKVIDFGIAKATNARLTEKTLFTEHRQLIGTLEYMSPEQADGSLDIDTRTDIYSLGVMLYELLTGAPPFDSKQLRSAAFGEIQRIIREVDPPNPSTRLSQNTETIASVAASRDTEPKKLGSIVRGELDWIVMKALEKDRSRRYETANGLAMDIRRYLGGEAVVAAPPGAAYRLKKFVKRNKGPVIATGGVAATLVLGLAGTIWQARVASEQRDIARTEAARAVAAEADAHQRADELKQVADFQGQMLAQVDPASAGVKLSENVRARFEASLAKAGVPDDQRPQQIESFANQWSRINATDTALELIDLTILKPAMTAIDQQFADQPAIAATLRHVLAQRYHDLGLSSAALTLQDQALSVRRRVLGEEHPDTLQAILGLGVYMSALGRINEAELLYREALEKSRRVRGNDDPETLVCVANMGGLMLDKGLFSEAERYYREALEARRRVLGEDDPDTLSSLNGWARLLQEQGKLDESEQAHRDVLAKRRRALGEDHRSTLTSINNLATLLRSQGKLDESITYLREALEKRKRVLGEMHPSTLSSIQGLGSVLGSAGHQDEAEALLRDALGMQQRLLGRDHDSTLATMGNLAVLLIGQNKFAEAEPMCRETLERRRRVFGENHNSTLIANNVMGLVLIRQDKFAEGEPYWQEAVAISRRVLGPAHPDTLVYMHNLAGLANDQEKPAEAERLYREVMETGGPAVGAGHPTVLSATRRLGAMLLEQKRYAEAEAVLAAAEPAARKSYTGSSERSLGALLRDLAAARTGLNQFAAAEPIVLEAHAIFVKTRGPEHAETRGCTEMLVDFYTLWNKAAPGKGYDTKAVEWKAKLEAIQPPSSAPASQPEKPKP